MEEDEMEMSTEELRTWIRGMVMENPLISTGVQEKCNQLQSLLERRVKRASRLARLHQSVAACEATVKKLYSLLGWEYKDTDSDADDDDDITGNTASGSPSGLASLLPKLHNRENLHSDEGRKILESEPIVVLTRLPTHTIRSFSRWIPEDHDIAVKSLDVSDTLWKHRGLSSDSDFVVPNDKSMPNKRKKMNRTNKKLSTSHASPKASTNTEAKVNVTTTSPPQTSINRNANRKRKRKAASTATSTPPGTTNGVSQVDIRTPPCQTSPRATNPAPGVLQGELTVNTSVLARRSAMCWQLGKILEIVTKEDGRLKYKVHFEPKGKSLVSAHHIALDCPPQLDQLLVGTRVVVRFPRDQQNFCPGVMAELPDKRNKLRFLVFMDDERPAYVALPSLRLVYRPLKDPLDDIPEGAHKNFIKGYIDVWPYPPKTQYIVGHKVNAELDGVLQRCEVQTVDCSLMEVVFLTNQHTVWLYRGSPRLEHIINLKKPPGVIGPRKNLQVDGK
ncbi:uncharacterized protein LOC120826404 isoform X1 [Gasterosteus aculeatus]